MAGATGQNFYQHNQPSELASYSQPPAFVSVKAIKDSQLVSGSAPVLGYAKSYSAAENSELLYKLFRGETRLVRSLLEANGFSYTESHDWNILWSNSGCKSYLYEGLNEY
jgi:hypothetical protein